LTPSRSSNCATDFDTAGYRYAHLFDDPQRAAVERVGAIVGAAGQDAAKEPVELKPRGRSRGR
jgi:hypothetical protein